MDVRARVRAILAEQALVSPEALRDDTRLADVGLDSLGLLGVVFAVEEAFGVAVPSTPTRPRRATSTPPRWAASWRRSRGSSRETPDGEGGDHGGGDDQPARA